MRKLNEWLLRDLAMYYSQSIQKIVEMARAKRMQIKK